MTQDELRDRLDDETALLVTLYGECRGEPIQGIIAVGCVIRNRSTHPNPARFGGTVKDVCLKPHQFSCWWGYDSNTTQVYGLAETFVRDAPFTAYGYYVVSELHWIAVGILSGDLRDITHDADHYLTTELWKSKDCPEWARSATPVATIGAHSFFRLG